MISKVAWNLETGLLSYQMLIQGIMGLKNKNIQKRVLYSVQTELLTKSIRQGGGAVTLGSETTISSQVDHQK